MNPAPPGDNSPSVWASGILSSFLEAQLLCLRTVTYQRGQVTLSPLAYCAVHATHMHSHQNGPKRVCSPDLCSGLPCVGRGKLMPECDHVKCVAWGEDRISRTSSGWPIICYVHQTDTLNSQDLAACWDSRQSIPMSSGWAAFDSISAAFLFRLASASSLIHAT